MISPACKRGLHERCAVPAKPSNRHPGSCACTCHNDNGDGDIPVPVGARPKGPPPNRAASAKAQMPVPMGVVFTGGLQPVVEELLFQINATTYPVMRTREVMRVRTREWIAWTM